MAEPETQDAVEEDLLAVNEDADPPPPVAPVEASPPPRDDLVPESSLTMEEATARLGPEILQTLEDKFNGSLTEIRSLDEKDQLL